MAKARPSRLRPLMLRFLNGSVYALQKNHPNDHTYRWDDFNDSMITATAAILIDFCLLTHGFCPLTAEVPLLFMLAMQSVNLGSTDDEHY